MPPGLILSFMYESRVSGAIQGRGWHPLLHFGVVAFEKGAFGSFSITVGQLTKDSYVSLTIQLNISHLFTHS